MITNVSVDIIENHPDNPRKNLGDLAELMNSIDESGILQNLTIVEQPDNPGYYWSVIGNRRLEAAKRLGLEKVPCIISSMDHKEQLATMLLENMQRVDLTPFEQAQGFQMMLDVGESMDDISEKTGFSESTVRSRVKLLELDQEKLKEVSDRQVNLTDYMRLERIKDIDRRNKVLESIGTADFNYELESAIRDQEKQDAKEEIIEVLKLNGAIEINTKDTYGKEYIDSCSFSEDGIKELKEIEGYEFYTIAIWGASLYKTKEEKQLTEEEILKQKQKEEEERRKKELELRVKDLNDKTKSLREDFLISLTENKLKENFGMVIKLIFEVDANFFLWGDDYNEIFDLGIEGKNKDKEEIKSLALEVVERSPYTSIFKALYHEEFKHRSYFNFKNEYSEDKGLDMLYEFMQEMGYQMSEEEIQLQNGSHEIFNNHD